MEIVGGIFIGVAGVALILLAVFARYLKNPFKK